MAAVGGNIVRFTYTGEEDIPHDATHVFVDAKIIRARTFSDHPTIVEVICHDKVEKIEEWAFRRCPRLRRLIMRGVKIVEGCVFSNCRALTDVECDKLEIIGTWAFAHCKSLRSINLLYVRVVEDYAFACCKVLTKAKFGNKLERFDMGVFINCTSLERITIPLKDGMITEDHIFKGCASLKHVDLVEGEELRETIAALHFEEWREDMNEEITSINQNLPNADAGGGYNGNGGYDDGEKALVIRSWLRSVLGKIIHYQTEHQRVLDVAAATLELALPRDIAINNVLSFLELPPHTFGVEDREDAEGDDSGTEEE